MPSPTVKTFPLFLSLFMIIFPSCEEKEHNPKEMAYPQKNILFGSPEARLDHSFTLAVQTLPTYNFPGIMDSKSDGYHLHSLWHMGLLRATAEPPYIQSGLVDLIESYGDREFIFTHNKRINSKNLKVLSNYKRYYESIIKISKLYPKIVHNALHSFAKIVKSINIIDKEESILKITTKQASYKFKILLSHPALSYIQSKNHEETEKQFLSMDKFNHDKIKQSQGIYNIRTSSNETLQLTQNKKIFKHLKYKNIKIKYNKTTNEMINKFKEDRISAFYKELNTINSHFLPKKRFSTPGLIYAIIPCNASKETLKTYDILDRRNIAHIIKTTNKDKIQPNPITLTNFPRFEREFPIRDNPTIKEKNKTSSYNKIIPTIKISAKKESIEEIYMDAIDNILRSLNIKTEKRPLHKKNNIIEELNNSDIAIMSLKTHTAHNYEFMKRIKKLITCDSSSYSSKNRFIPLAETINTLVIHPLHENKISLGPDSQIIITPEEF